MISILLDRGAQLRALSHSQMTCVKQHFILYLVQAISFREALAGCVVVLHYDQADLRAVIRDKLSEMIGDPYCNTVVKPAIIALARGNPTGFTKARCNPRFCRQVIQQNQQTFNKVLRAVQFRPTGARGLAYLEDIYVEKVRPHARNYVMKSARFLLSADHGLTIDDMVNDLLLLALRAFRWYYPFRSGLHMLNTMRATISNRGRSLVKYNVADSRRRLIMLPSGEMYNRESSGGYDAACNAYAGDINGPERNMPLDMMMHRVAAKDGSAPVLKFVNDEEMQDKFVSWAGYRLGHAFHSLEELSVYVRDARLSYGKLLARYLNQPYESVQSILSELQAAM